jgi:hypothetical protein
MITVRELKQLAEEFGLPCVIREDEITIIGWVQILVFNIEAPHNQGTSNKEKYKCLMTQII